MKGSVAAISAAGLLSLGAAAAGPTWSPNELQTLRTLWLAAPLAAPPDPSNRFADEPMAAALGESLFSDQRLSANGRVSCATCHQPDHAFTDARPVGVGVGEGARRTMPVAVAVHSPWQFWDGRADSLWAQALGPVENPVEHGFTRTEVARIIASHYRDSYERLFGPLPDMTDVSRFPLRATPAGDPGAKAAWGRMASADQEAVNRIFANFGKAVAAYERTLKVRPARFDAYLAGVFGTPNAGAELSPAEVRGLRLFIGKARCSSCHNGSLLSNEGFANTGVPGRPGAPPDTGRAAGIDKALADPFNCRGAYSDAGANGCDELDFAVAGSAEQIRAYKVPSLRGVGQRAPYMHAGQFASLDQVLDHYSRAPKAPQGMTQLQPLNLSPAERSDIIAFLRTLNDQPTPTR